jgi:hypothetical protein
MSKKDSKEVLGKFLQNIKIGKYEEATKHVTLTFADQYSKTELLDWVKSCIPFRIFSYRIVGRFSRKDKVNEDVFHTYKVQLKGSFGNVVDSFPNVICEIKPYKPSKDGKWGVNPISMIPKGMSKLRRD